jgi:hypothetical protein
MDLNGYWQENKRFLVGVAAGTLVFAIGWMLIDNYLGDELKSQVRAAESARRKLRTEALHTTADLERAEQENAALVAALAQLSQAVAFQARPGFALDPARGSPSNQYFAVVSATREELLTLAGRGNLRLPENLGLPALSPTREAEIERYLQGLDLVDRVVRMALEAGVTRVDAITMQLDPRLTSRQGVGNVERTRVEMKLAGPASPLVQLLLLTQQPAPGGGPLAVEKANLQTARTSSETLLEVVFVVARVTTPTPNAN